MRYLAALHREVKGECSVTRQDCTKGDETRTESDGALAMLQADHHTIRRLFQHYEATNDQDLRRWIAADVCTVLERHTFLEDTVLYAAFAVATDEEGERLLGDAFRAHQLCTLLMEDLCERTPDDARPATSTMPVIRTAKPLSPRARSGLWRYGTFRQVKIWATIMG
jgi:hypothetical protein